MFDGLLRNASVTPDGVSWARLALDPFHDANHQVAGYPDADGSQTVVSCFQYQFEVPAPGAVNWDCHLFTLPQQVTTESQQCVQDANWLSVIEANPAVVIPTGLMNIRTGPAGAALAPAIPILAGNVYTAVPGAGVGTLANGITRIIGYGYEVTNTTAELYKQGSVTSYRMPQSTGHMEIIHSNNAGDRLYKRAGTRLRQVPSTVAQCNLMKGSVTWAASEGVYAVAAQNSISNPLTQESNQTILYDPNPAPTGGASMALINPIFPYGVGAAAPALSAGGPNVNKLGPFDTTGSYFTGLSPQTTLMVKMRVYVEKAPTPIETDLAVLATPSAGYDPRVLELYSHAVSRLPVAVRVCDNASGDWWRSILNVVGKVASGLGLAFSPVVPGAHLIGDGVAHLANAITKKSHPPPPPRPLPQRPPPLPPKPAASRMVVEGQDKQKQRRKRNPPQ